MHATTPPSSELETQLLAAHASGDAAAMAALYEQAASRMEHKGDEASAAFYYTQAYIFALDAGSAQAIHLESWLRARNRH